MSEITVVNTDGAPARFSPRHVVGTLVESGVPVDEAVRRADRLAEILEVSGVTTVTTDAIRHALEDLARPTPATAIAELLRRPRPTPLPVPRPPPTPPPSLVAAAPKLGLAAGALDGRPALRVAFALPPVGPAAILRFTAADGPPVAYSVPLRGTGEVAVPIGEGALPRDRWLIGGLVTEAGESWPGGELGLLRTAGVGGLLLDVRGGAPVAALDPDELVRRLNELIEQYERWLRVFKGLPTNFVARLGLLLKALYDLYGKLPHRAWVALWHFLRCDSERLRALAVEEIKQLLDALLALAELELEAAEGATPRDETTIASLRAWVEKLREAVRAWAPDLGQDAAARVLEGLKQFLKDNHAAILDALRDYFGVDVRDELDKLGEKVASRLAASIVRALLLKIIGRILARRLGEEAAKKALPGVGAVLAAIELALVIGLVIKLENLAKDIDRLLFELIKALAGEGLEFPNGSEGVWLTHPFHAGARVSICAYVRCAEQRPDGCVKWNEEACQLKIGGLTPCVVTTATPDKLDGGTYKFPVKIPDGAVEATECFRNTANKIGCYTFMRVTVTLAGGGVLTYVIIFGAKVF